MNAEQKKNNKAKPNNKYASWATTLTVRLALSNADLYNGPAHIERVVDFCRVEIACRVEREVTISTLPLMHQFLSQIETALVASSNPEEEPAVHAFIKAMEVDLGNRSIAVATAMSEEHRKMAMALALKIPALKAAPRKLTSRELLDSIWAPGKPDFLPESVSSSDDNSSPEKAPPFPDGVLVPAPAAKLLLTPKEIWTEILRENGLDSQSNLDQAMAWAFHFGFFIFETLPVTARMLIAGGKVVHARSVKPKEPEPVIEDAAIDPGI